MTDIDDVILYDRGGAERVRLSPRRAQALESLLDAQIAIEDGGVFRPEPTAEERDQTMHGTRHPIQDSDAVLWPIACRAAELAQRRGEELPKCRWVADDSGIDGGVACTRCGKAEGPGMPRCSKLRQMVDGTWLPSTSDGLKTQFVLAKDLQRGDVIITSGERPLKVTGMHRWTNGGPGTGLPTRHGVDVRTTSGAVQASEDARVRILRRADASKRAGPQVIALCEGRHCEIGGDPDTLVKLGLVREIEEDPDHADRVTVKLAGRVEVAKMIGDVIGEIGPDHPHMRRHDETIQEYRDRLVADD